MGLFQKHSSQLPFTNTTLIIIGVDCWLLETRLVLLLINREIQIVLTNSLLS